MTEVYTKIIRAGGAVALASSISERHELEYQLVKAVKEFAEKAGVIWKLELVPELVSRAKVTDLPRTGDAKRQLVEWTAP